MSPYVYSYLSAFHKGIEKKVATVHRLGERKKPEGLKAEDIVPMNGFWRTVGDVGTASFGGYRAGKSETMARSIGQEPGFRLRYPMTAQMLEAIGGEVGGAISGGALGFGLGKATGADRQGLGNMTAGGVFIGGVTGALLGLIGNTRARRDRMREINRDFDEAKTINPTIRGVNPLSFYAGAHDQGRSIAGQILTGGPNAMPGGVRYQEVSPYALMPLTMGLQLANPGAGSIAAGLNDLAGSVSSKFQAATRNREILRNEPKPIRIVQ